MIPVDHHTYAQTHKLRCKLIFAGFSLLLQALRTESAHEMLPLSRAASEGSDEPAHPHSLAMDIAATYTMKVLIVPLSGTLNYSSGSSHVRTDAQTKM